MNDKEKKKKDAMDKAKKKMAEERCQVVLAREDQGLEEQGSTAESEEHKWK